MANLSTLRPSPTALLNPRCDPSFKAMFTADTEESNAALKDFISAILSREVEEITLLPNEPVVEIITESQMSFDVGVKFNDGEKIDLEMQARNREYDYSARAEILAARLLSTNNARGDKWETPPAYQISVLDFSLNKSDKPALSWYTMRNESEEHKEYIDSLINSEGGLMNARSSLLTVSQDEINWARQNSIDKARRDYNDGLYNAEKRGLKKGMEQGERKAKVEMARQLLSMRVLSSNQIAQATGLSLEEIDSL